MRCSTSTKRLFDGLWRQLRDVFFFQLTCQVLVQVLSVAGYDEQGIVRGVLDSCEVLTMSDADRSLVTVAACGSCWVLLCPVAGVWVLFYISKCQNLVLQGV